MNNKVFDISDSKEYGVILKINDIELADEFDDFLSEDCYAFSQMKLEKDYVYFYFGQASSIEKVEQLVKKFSSRHVDT